MYNPGVTLSVGSYAEVANSTIHLIFVDQEIGNGGKFCSMDVTLPWGDFDPFFGGYEGDIITREITNGFYVIKIMSINIAAHTATLRAMSYARGYVADIGISHNLPSMADPGGTVNYDFELTNQSPFNVQIRWLVTSKIGSQYDYPTDRDEFALPPTTYHDIGCWYDDWAVGGTCSNGQTLIGDGGSGHVTGSFAASTNQGQYENIAFFVFVYVSNYWDTGKHEYVRTAITEYATLITPCAGVVCDPLYICDGCDSYYNICDPANPTGPCIKGTLKQANDPLCISDGYIYISSTPTGATIYVDGFQIGTTGSTPIVVKVAVGTNPHTVELRLTNYETWIDNNVNVNCASPVIISQVLTAPAPYELHLQLGNITPSSYVLSTLNKFADIFSNALSTMVPGIIINSITYVEADHEIVIEMQYYSLQSSSVANNLNLNLNNYYYYANNLNNYHIQTLIGPLLLILLPAIPALIAVIMLWLGFDIPFFSFRKKATSLNTEVHITTCLSISESTCINPPEDVIIKFNGETKTANATNSYTVTFSNVKATTDTTYPVEAYIPLSAESKVYKASYKGNILVLPPRTDENIKLKINQSQERDYAPPCPLKYPDSTQVPTGTNIKIMHILKDEYGVTEIEEYGIRSVKADGCIDPVKIPAVLTDNMLDYQVIPKDVDPNSPDSTPVPGDTDTIKRYTDIKNKIAVFTYSTLNNDITVDKIEIKNSDTSDIIKTISGPDIKSGYNEIDGIPPGRYQTIVTKSGYNLSSCSSNCIVEFTADYLQSVSFSAILQALVTTCDISIYILDKDGKEIKTIPSVKMCKDTVCQNYTITTGKKLDLKEVTEGSYKFTITADKYNFTPPEQTKNVSCTDPQLIFKMDPTGEDIIPATMELTVNDLKGSVSVAKNTSFTVKVTGANPGETVEIRNISNTPDTLLASGDADGGGVYETNLSFDLDTTFDLQALQGCGVLICAKSSNIIDLKIGAGAKECIIPNPLGGCLVTKETAAGIGTFLLVALFGVAALGMVIMKAPAGGERVIVTAPAYPGGPQQTTVREKTKTVLGKAMEK